ncbi:MAG TPA: VWA domain-containing protein [Actinomycetes bacterium]|nr:VWA domain-containing protein [Actinomycetes bacterium]
MPDLAETAAAFGRRLHEAGVPVTPERSATFARGVLVAAPAALGALYWVGRVTLVSSRSDLPVYDRVFAEVFGAAAGEVDEPGGPDRGRPRPRAAVDDDEAGPSLGRARADVRLGGEQPQSAVDDQPAALPAVDDTERLHDVHFARCTPEELQLLAALVSRLPVEVPLRETRRSRRHPRGRRIDVRASVRAARSTAGDPVRLVRRKRRQRPRRLVLIADVSGSMQPYARVYLHLMRGAVRSLDAEAFVFATRLTRLTRLLSYGRTDQSYAAVAAGAPDWSGGTRIGAALAAFLDQHGRRGLARGAVVVIVSDGWEHGSPEVLRESMERLSRLANHVVWVNPRVAAAGFRPLTGGMAAVLPYVDSLVSGHSVRAVEEVLRAIRDGRPT